MFDLVTDTLQWIISAPFICLGWIIVGAIAGDLARRFMKTDDRSLFADILLGILGAIVGGLLLGLFGGILQWDLPGGGIPLLIANLIVATLGAMALIAIRRAITGSLK